VPLFDSAVELHLYGLIWLVSHPVMQKVRIVGFLFENRLHWHFKVEKNFNQQLFYATDLFIYLFTNKILVRNSLYVFDKWGKM
jgi:hypothetical protein